MRHHNRIMFAISASLLFSTTALTRAQTRLFVQDYAFNNPRMKSMNLDGSNITDLFAPANPIPTADWLLVGIAVDEAAGKVYWTHGGFNDGRIRRANLDGSQQQMLVSSLKIPRGLAIDPTAGKIYWCDAPPQGTARGLILRANFDGTNVETVFSLVAAGQYDPNFSFVGNPTVDSVNGYVYYAINSRIARTNLDGPPFRVETVVTGVSTALRVQLDTANNHIYWVDSNTISDAVVRANLDNTGHRVVADATPGVVESSGISDLLLDLADGKLYWSDEINTMVVNRANLDGSGAETIYPTPDGWNSTNMAFNHEPPQPMTDCNNNGVRDSDDVGDGTSADCNANGIPDECEDDPCAPPNNLLLQPVNASLTVGRALGGTPPNTRWTIFQPFDVPAAGWSIGSIATHGFTTNYQADAGHATLLPDNGANYPNEAAPIASATFTYRFAGEWESSTFNVPLPAGRHWLRLTGDGWYTAQVSIATGGLNSISRSSGGSEFLNQPPIALRIGPPTITPGDLDGDGDVDIADLAQLLAHFGTLSGATYADGDIDGDGDVDIGDLAILLSNFGS